MREQQLQNLRMAMQKYLQPEKSSKLTKYLPENHWTYEQACCTTGILWYKNESNYVPEQLYIMVRE